MLMRYEDFALFPLETSMKIYEYLGLPFTFSKALYIKSLTSPEKESREMDVYSLTKLSKERPFKWRSFMSFEENLLIQKTCQNILKEFGYRIFDSLQEYNNFSLPVLINFTDSKQ